MGVGLGGGGGAGSVKRPSVFESKNEFFHDLCGLLWFALKDEMRSVDEFGDHSGTDALNSMKA